MIMPPSVVLIVYGILTEQSIGALFVAGIFPAILVTILFIISIFIMCHFAPEQGPPGESFSWKEKVKSLVGMGETLIVFILVIGGCFMDALAFELLPFRSFFLLLWSLATIPYGSA